MDVEVAAGLTAAEPGAQQQLRRSQSAAGDDRGAPRAHRVGTPLAVTGAAAGGAAHANRAAVFDQDSVRLHAGADSRPRGHRARQVADVHAALGVDPAAEGAGAALHTVAGVAGDRAAARPDRLRALHRELAVAPHPLRVERGDAQELLGLGEVGAEVVRPLDAVAPAPVVEDRVGGAEAGARVDHGRPADRPPNRNGDRRAPLGDRQSAVAVEGGDRLQRVARVAVAVVMASALEHDHVEPRLGEGRRGRGAAGARADDHHVALLGVSGRRRVAQRPGWLRHRAVGQPAARLEAEPLLDPRVDRVAERREGLGHQQQLVMQFEPGVLHAPQEVLASGRVEPAEAPGERQPLEGAQAELDPSQEAGRDRGQELGDRAGHLDLALRRRQTVDARRHRRADRAQGALLSGGEPWRALSTGVDRAADPTRERPQPQSQQGEEAVD